MWQKNKVKIGWSPNFAYAIGLIVTDGNLSTDRRHINFTSKDLELIKNFKMCLKIDNSIGKKARGGEKIKKYFVIQFGDVVFYKFLMDIGLMPAKSKIIKDIKIPNKYFFDFLRGHFDGDGTFYAYFDPRWKSSYMFYAVFISASKNHILWLQNKIYSHLKIKGHITKSKRHSTYHLKYAKKESLQLLPKMYYDNSVICLSRKRTKVYKILNQDNQNNKARVL